MFEQAFKNIDDVLWKEAGCTTELDYTEQTSWLLFLKYLDGLEEDKATEAALSGKKYAYVAYTLPPLTREDRAAKAKVAISTHFNSQQRVFLDFVLSHYVSVGVEELEPAKLTPLLRLKYHDSIADAVADLGKPDEIGRIFSGFQKHLYADQVA